MLFRSTNWFLKNGLKDVDALSSFKNQLVTIIGFLIGCFLGAIAGKFFGLGTLIIPGAAIIICYLYHRKV